jgi:hypothetical protein
MQHLKLIFFIAAIATFASHLPETRACSCLPPPAPANEFALVNAVFMGKVVSFELTGDAFSPRLAKFSVTKIWKGERSAVSEILTANNSAACGYDFLVGETYVVYAYKFSDGKLHTYLCTRTKRTRDAADDLKFLATAASFPLAVGNAWTLQQKQTQIRYKDNIVDSLHLGGKSYSRFEHFREFNNVALRLADDAKLYMRLDTTEQRWLDFGATVGDSWPVTAPNKLATWTVQLQSRSDTIKTPAGTFTQCLRFHFKFPGADNDWDEWYAPNVGPVKRLQFGIAPFEYNLQSAIVNGNPLPTAVEENPQDNAVRNFALHQNYPNPFSAAGNNATAIRYRLNSNAAVYLSIYDMLGREIKTLARLIEPAGEHVAVWDGFNSAGEPAPSGIYFYRLQIEKSTEVKKLVLTR